MECTNTNHKTMDISNCLECENAALRQQVEEMREKNEKLKESSKWYCDYANRQDLQICEEIARCNKAEAERDSLREALTFYAEESNWYIRFGGGKDFTCTGTSACDADSGAIARQALSGKGE